MGGIILLLEGGGAFTGDPFISHHFLRNHPIRRALVGERRELRFKFPTRIPGNFITKLSRTPKKGTPVTTSTTRHHKHISPRIPVQQVSGSANKSPYEKTTALQVFPLTKNVKGLSRNRIDTPSFNSHRFVLHLLSRLLFSPPLSSLFFLGGGFQPDDTYAKRIRKNVGRSVMTQRAAQVRKATEKQGNRREAGLKRTKVSPST